MSIRYVATVLDKLSDLTATDTLVLIALADFASDDTRQCWPSIATIARRARLTRRGVQKRLRALEARGLVQTAQGGHQYGRNTSSQYILKFDYDGKIVPDVIEVYPQGRTTFTGGANAATGKGERRDIEGRTPFAPSVIRSVIEPKSGKKPPTKEELARAAALLSDEELEEKASTGRLSAVEEYEREHRRKMRPRRAAP